MIAVVDYGMGNLRSVMNDLERLEVEAELVDDPIFHFTEHGTQRAKTVLAAGVDVRLTGIGR